jgi:hypothetical protein
MHHNCERLSSDIYQSSIVDRFECLTGKRTRRIDRHIRGNPFAAVLV